MTPGERLDPDAIRARCPQETTGAECYREFTELGFGYGPSFQVVQHRAVGATEAIALLRLPAHLRADADEYGAHPALFDAALQTAGSILTGPPGSGRPVILPYSVGAAELTVEHLPQTCHAYARRTDDGAAPGIRTFDVRLLSEDGTVVARIERFTLRAVPTATERSAGSAARGRRSAAAPSWLVAPRGGAADRHSPAPLQGAAEPQPISPDLLSAEALCFEPYWQPVDAAVPAAHSTGGHLVLLDGNGDGGGSGSGRDLAAALAESTGAVVTRVDLTAGPDFTQLVDTVVERGPQPVRIVHVPARDGELGQLLDSGFHTALAFCRAWIVRRAGRVRYLYVHPEDTAAHAAMSGFARAVRAEHPGLALTALAHPASADLPRLIAAELAAEDAPVVVRADGEPLHRLVPAWRTLALPPASTPSPFAAPGAHLITGGTGGIGLHLAERLASYGNAAEGKPASSSSRAPSPHLKCGPVSGS